VTDGPAQLVEREDVQGNVLRPYGYEYVRHLLLRVVDPAGARAALTRLCPLVTSGAHWGDSNPATTLNFGLSYAGLRAMGIRKDWIAELPYAFRAGMKRRAPILGDNRASAPENWERNWQQEVHAIASLHAEDESFLEPRAAEIEALLAGGFEVAFAEHGGVLTAAKFEGPGEHFGFRDGIGQTEIEGFGDESTRGDGSLDDNGFRGVAAGELLLGYRNESAEYPSPRVPAEIGRNGTFLVFRKLAQHVNAFRAYLERHGHAYGDKEKLAAKLVGRWRDGTPLALSPDKMNPDLASDPKSNNDFGFADDPLGAKCPLGAHIRRARPRDALGFGGRLANTRRLMRRGLPYGKWVPEDQTADDSPRGLLFYAFNVDIEAQFEFIQQQWLNYGNHFGQGNDKDVLSGDHDGSGKAVIQASGPGEVPYLCTGLERFIDTRGGEYFFIPGLAALGRIAASR
jgi:Dyp-type peroxidase family